MTAKSSFGILQATATSNNLLADNFRRELSAPTVQNARPTDEAYSLSDGGGLALHISPAGSRVWRYRFRLHGAQQVLTIGEFPAISLSDARLAHRGARWLVERGINPLAHIRSEITRMLEEERRQQFNTFEAVCRVWMEKTAAKLRPRTVEHRKAMIEAYILPKIGSRPIVEIRRRDLLDLLHPIDEKHPITGRHCRLYIKQTFDWAVRKEIVQGNPCPGSKDLSKQEGHTATPRKALPLNQIGQFIRTLKDAPDTDPQTKAALRLVMLTWCRTSEVTAARWEEFDLDGGKWVIPKERMKANRAHTIYLSRQAVELLKEVKQFADSETFVFQNRRRPDSHMGRMTLTNWRKRHGFAEIMDVHGLRAVASTWANESGRYRPDVIETALAHAETNDTRAAYNRAIYAEPLRAMWQDWADLLDEKEAIARAENVVQLGVAA
ncbi:MAG: tyrosine-type recombinase/integrase [Betaproteobacteria bacterium]